MEQGEWLQRMGIHERAKAMVGKAGSEKDAPETVRKIQASVQRLTERGGGAMGKVYKVMAVVPESGGQRPVGFGGGVQS
jgi:SAM-dependent MidA family methyltransferase